MRKTVVVLLLAAIAATALAQDTEKQKKTRLTLKSEKVSVTVQDMLLSVIVQQFRIITEVEILIDNAVNKELTCTLDIKHVPVKEALDKILKPHNLDYFIRKDGSIFISTKGKIAGMKIEDFLKKNELLVVLRDGTRVKGRVNVANWNLKTAYGNLSIPVSDIRAIWPGKKQEETREEDKVETVRFTATGKLEIDKLEIDTGKGKLTIPATDIKEILFPKAVFVKLFEIKPDGKWLDTGIKLKKGDVLKITAQGSFEINRITFKPDGKTHTPSTVSGIYYEGCPLVGKVGKTGQEFRVGCAIEIKVEKKGNLYLHIQVSPTLGKATRDAKGSYKVKVEK